MRPNSYKRGDGCGNCVFAVLLATREGNQLWCFRGEQHTIEGYSEFPSAAEVALSDGRRVDDLTGDEFDREWAKRVVVAEDVCDEHRKKS